MSFKHTFEKAWEHINKLAFSALGQVFLDSDEVDPFANVNPKSLELLRFIQRTRNELRAMGVNITRDTIDCTPEEYIERYKLMRATMRYEDEELKRCGVLNEDGTVNKGEQ